MKRAAILLLLAAMAMSSVSNAYAVELIQLGTSSKYVKQLQEDLTELRFYDGKISGNAGEMTIEAIKAFQKKHNLTQDGIAGVSTLAKIEKELGRTQSKYGLSSSGNSSSSSSMATGNDDVRTMQAGLKKLGLYTGDVTGHIGTKTEAAIRAFQQKYDLTVNGKVNSATLSKLKSVLGGGTTSSSVSGAASGDVMTMQEGLKDLGLYYGEITGKIGTKTEAAIRAFQQKYGLTVDGKVGSQTLSKLKSVLDGETNSSSSSADVEDVMEMQSGLKKLGLYTGDVTGNIGTKTETAIRAFQKKYGLTVNGEVNSATLSKLNDLLSGGKTGTSSSADVEDVMAMQSGLKELGFYYGDITGNVGTKTEAAIRAFQKKYDLTVNGEVNSATLNKLDDVLDGAEEEAAAAADAEDVMTMQSGLKELDLYYGEVTGNIGSKTETAIRAFQKKYGLTVNGEVNSATLSKLKEVLGGNVTSTDADDVMTMQSGLKELDLYYGEITGNIGTKTEAAIRAFQKKYGLTVDGKIGTKTLAKLEEVLSGKEAADEAEANKDDIMKMQEGLKELGLYYADITGKIGTKTEAAIRDFQKKYGLTVNGEVNSATLAKLKEVLAYDSDSGKIIDLHWFNEKSYYTSHGVKKGLTITIMDVKTGKQFNGRVQSTGYHADVEPKTAADTEIMCDIYGVSKASSISYVRRPVIIKTNVNGKRYTFAASMYGEAHGSQVITDNNYDGQFCIHFRHSTTSGTQVEYEMNQSPIDTAVNYAVSKLGMKHVTDRDDAP